MWILRMNLGHRYNMTSLLANTVLLKFFWIMVPIMLRSYIQKAVSPFSETVKRDKICSPTNRIITAKDHASVQLYTCHIVESGIYTGQVCTFALSGFLRAQV
ncbi:hypothetical protein MKW98_021939 [Papaver atlanticum]|uniref:Uncharacterized protein n=1 Tax=Papaver atlanticum TaxID=357466 RepID=A0AAD4TJ07_9MAGN|nr:hypothetical protein MKW98_021939 [Papaver atlanticum]